ncbi:MAG: hydroxymethylbilane synthase [Anaerolineae bacterium]
MKLTFATRASALARWQTQWVMDALQRLHPDLACEEKLVATQGDKTLDKPLPEIGGKGVFTEELEAELLRGTVQCAVHSLKDLPVDATRGLTLGCIPPRADVRDALVSVEGYKLLTLPRGAKVGTSSLRRSAQLLAIRPDLQIASLRGNVDTRVRRALHGEYDAIILAGAGLIRLGLDKHVTEWIAADVMLPAPGQAAMAVQCRADDAFTLDLLRPLDDLPTRKAVTAERAFLSRLGGGCAVPVAALAQVTEAINLTGLVASTDGTQMIHVTGKGDEPGQLGKRLANEALAKGAAAILAEAVRS